MDKKLAANSTLAHYRIVSEIRVGGALVKKIQALKLKISSRNYETLP